MARTIVHLVLLTLLAIASGGELRNISAIQDAIPQLNNLDQVPSSRPITSGGQSFARCCLLAVEASFQVDQDGNGTLEYSSQPFIYPTTINAVDFASYAAKGAGSFPCGAQFDGNMSGAPAVRVPYSWCRETCDGWQLSHRGNLTQWIGPLVGFILPCLAFCLNIPRKRKLSIPPWVFSPSPEKLLGFFLYPVRLLVALAFVAIDTVGWLCICFALAGPMLLSGVYETWIDMRLLRYLWKEIVFDRKMEDALRTNQVLTMKLRAQLLLLVVVGNIDIISTERQGAYPEIMRVVRGLEHEDQNRPDNVIQVKSKLLALCSSQNSFGSAVGAPVVFFVGAFIYNMVDIQARLGDNDTAHALAFGMWWMTIPFLAIISCLLLASNNPSSLHGILASPMRASSTWKIFQWKIFEGAYGGPYEPVDLWDRGPSKMYWLEKTLEQYEAIENFGAPAPGYPLHTLQPGANHGQPHANHPYQQHGPHLQQPHPGFFPSASQISESSLANSRRGQLGRLKRRMKPNAQSWCLIFFAAATPLFTAMTLAFITSYTTPRVGLACRSLTHLCYFVTQLVQMAIWMLWDRVAIDDERIPETRMYRAKRVLCVVLKLLFGSIAAFVSIGGTLMQLMGVYRNCLCKIPVQYWFQTDHPDAYVDLGQNSALSIENAQLFWVRTAGAATGILCATCALAWWFQRHLRDRYKDLVQKVELNPSW
ncbi:hypothetical protein B0T14DRAFT_567252 [Immersiella caudata]|uniref:Uncharacterized protein n=1 Tax=Immersiella caudata TaxID=314043 RepID=A0AA40C0T0_9PEZI|nr:hypothetical protein B0T14DRAFT_567252 [Immersiella caudata]